MVRCWTVRKGKKKRKKKVKNILTPPPFFFDVVLHLPSSYYHSIPAAPELGQSRKVDISRLRDIRKRLDTGHITTKELEIIAMECVDELVELCSGNTTYKISEYVTSISNPK